LIGVASAAGIQTFLMAAISHEESLGTLAVARVQHYLGFLSYRNQCKKSYLWL